MLFSNIQTIITFQKQRQMNLALCILDEYGTEWLIKKFTTLIINKKCLRNKPKQTIVWHVNWTDWKSKTKLIVLSIIKQSKPLQNVSDYISTVNFFNVFFLNRFFLITQTLKECSIAILQTLCSLQRSENTVTFNFLTNIRNTEAFYKKRNKIWM